MTLRGTVTCNPSPAFSQTPPQTNEGRVCLPGWVATWPVPLPQRGPFGGDGLVAAPCAHPALPAGRATPMSTRPRDGREGAAAGGIAEPPRQAGLFARPPGRLRGTSPRDVCSRPRGGLFLVAGPSEEAGGTSGRRRCGFRGWSSPPGASDSSWAQDTGQSEGPAGVGFVPPAEGRGPQDHRQKAFPPCWPQAVSPELSSQPPPSTPEEVAEEAHRLLGDGPRCGASGPSPALPACGVLHRGEVGTGVLHRAEVAWAAAQGVARGVARPRPGGRAGGWSSCCPHRWPPPRVPLRHCAASLSTPRDEGRPHSCPWTWMRATGLGRAATRWLLTAATAPSPTGVAGRRPKLPRGPLLLRPLPSFMMFNLSC